MDPICLAVGKFQDGIAASTVCQIFFSTVCFTAVMVTVGEVFTTVLAAYAFAYIPFRFKNALFLVLVATMMVPGEILMIPNYITLSNWGWIDSYKALIIPWCASIFFDIFTEAAV